MKTLTALLAGAALSFLPATGNTLTKAFGDVALTASFPTVDSIDFIGELIPGIPRATVIKGRDLNPRWECFGRIDPYTTIALNLSEGENYADAFRDLESLVIPNEFLQRLEKEISSDDSLSYRDWTFLNADNFYLQGILSEPGAFVITYFEDCPEPPLSPAKYLEGRIDNPEADKYNSKFTLDADFSLFQGYVSIWTGMRFNAGETVRLYSQRGFPSLGEISRFDKMEVVDEKGKVLFTYGPQS